MPESFEPKQPSPEEKREKAKLSLAQGFYDLLHNYTLQPEPPLTKEEKAQIPQLRKKVLQGEELSEEEKKFYERTHGKIKLRKNWFVGILGDIKSAIDLGLVKDEKKKEEILKDWDKLFKKVEERLVQKEEFKEKDVRKAEEIAHQIFNEILNSFSEEQRKKFEELTGEKELWTNRSIINSLKTECQTHLDGLNKKNLSPEDIENLKKIADSINDFIEQK